MKILIVTQYFWPEEFRINEIAIGLNKRGHEITILTGNPNYPDGKYFPGYGFRFMKESYLGVNIYRVPILPRGSNTISLIFNYISFVISGSLFTFFLKNKFDVVFAINFSPITAIIPAIVYKKRHKTKIILWVQDLWPESILFSVGLKSKLLISMLNYLVKFIYKNSDTILVQSKGFFKSIIDKGISATKLAYLPNCAEDVFFKPSNFSLEVKENSFPIGFNIMFAGNIGDVADFPAIIKAAAITKKYSNINWLIIGNGRYKEQIERDIITYKLQENVFLFDRIPSIYMPSLFKHANLLLISLIDEPTISLTIPSKLQSYLACGMPIIGMINGPSAEIIKEANCGYVVNASDYQSLAQVVIHASVENASILYEKGSNGKKYYYQNFSKPIIIDCLEKYLSESL